MAVSNGQVANQDTFNNAFPSKTNDDIIPVKYNLTNTDAASGDSLINLQKVVNEASVKVYATEQISSGGNISIDNVKGVQVRRIVSDGGDVTLSSTPFGNSGGWADGTRIQVVGGDNTNRCTLVFSDTDYGCILFGDFTPDKWHSVTLVWIEDELRWLEVGRNS